MTTIERKYELDWLRVFAVLLVFVYHTTRLFNLEDWHVKNPVTYQWVEIWNVWVTRWMMPLFFVISGASLFFALDKSRGFLHLLKTKFMRLMVPVIAAVFSHSILQVYIERVSHGTFSGTIIDFIPFYFNGPYLQIGGKGNFAFHGMHLWYLLFLFVYTLMLYPLLCWFKGGGRKTLGHISRFMALPGVMYVILPLPFFLLKAFIPDGILRAGNAGWGFLFYIWFLVAGFILYSDAGLVESVRKQRWISLLLSAVLTVTGLLLRFTSVYESSGVLLRFMVDSGFSYVGSWVMLLAIFGFAVQHLRTENSFLRYSSEAGIAAYILHQPIIVSLGFFAAEWSVPDTVKWLLVLLISFVLVMLPYEIIIRRINFFRVLFGMKRQFPVSTEDS